MEMQKKNKIITVTMNPAVDRTCHVDTMVIGGLNRLSNMSSDAGGKGINVSKMISVLGGTSIATGFLGGSAGREIMTVLLAHKIETDFVEIKSSTRYNLKVLSKNHGITEFNEPGPVITPQESQALREKLIGYAEPDTIFAFSGSLPQGVSPDIYQQLIREVKKGGSAVFLDTDGEAFSSAISARPDFIKPNKFELTQYFNVDENCSLSETVSLCRRFISKGIKMVALSMGQQGALFVNRQENLYAQGLQVKAASTVGAGDCMVGAMIRAFVMGFPFRAAAALAMAASAGAVTTQGTATPTRETIDGLIKQVEFKNVT